MEIVDANIVLRYLLGDNPDMQKNACQVIDNQIVLLLDEVMAEIVYVLEKVYQVNRQDISNTLIRLINQPGIICRNSNISIAALRYYLEYNIDFIDSILLAYSTVEHHKIHTYDKKLLKLIAKFK